MSDLTVTKKSVLSYQYERAVASFSDGSKLVFVPYKNWGNIEGFMGMGLYQQGRLTAAVADRISRQTSHESRGFWSKREEPNQAQFAEYLSLATERDLTQPRYNEIVGHSRRWIEILKNGTANVVDKPDFLEDIIR